MGNTTADGWIVTGRLEGRGQSLSPPLFTVHGAHGNRLMKKAWGRCGMTPFLFLFTWILETVREFWKQTSSGEDIDPASGLSESQNSKLVM